MRPVDVSGQRFGLLVAVKKLDRLNGVTRWICKCDCGIEKPVYLTLLKNGEARSCGCRRTPSLPLRARLMQSIKIDESTGCWEWQGNKSRAGYGSVSVPRGKRELQKTMSTHRISWSIFNGDIPEGLCVLHKCDNRKCVNPDHLFLGTHQDNMDDMIKKGRHASQVKKAMISKESP